MPIESKAQQKAAARAAWKGSGQAADSEVWFDIAEREGRIVTTMN